MDPYYFFTEDVSVKLFLPETEYAFSQIKSYIVMLQSVKHYLLVADLFLLAVTVDDHMQTDPI